MINKAKIKGLQIGLSITLGFCLLLASLVKANASDDAGKLNVFTDHQLVQMTKHRVYNSYAPTGDWPYIGRVGVEYEYRRLTYSLSYIHRSNLDLGGDEYNYDGVSVGIKYKYCLVGC